ncbi:hypothetical protein C8R47DRAFT_1218997 [Mycena vitilis]|nr:hypothetical protein C8R47DRAFT_1218997 [Mycena vitilis]
MPAFAITAHKAQGKTMRACVVNFTGCKGTESPYVMVSRATSLDALVILTPFPKAKICSRQSEDVRVECRRLEYLALQTVIAIGTPEEVARATREIRASYNAPSSGAPSSALSTVSAVATGDSDVYGRLDRLQRANAVLTAPVRRSRIPIGTGVTAPSSSSSTTAMAGSSHGGLVFLPPNSQPTRPRTRTRKRKLDDTSLPDPPNPTRKRGRQ